MNKKRRKELRIALEHVSAAAHMVESILQEEQDAIDNWPENLQGSDRYYDAEETQRHLEDLRDSLQEACEIADNIL